MSWPHFLANTPARSIALDGFVRTGPRFDPKGPRANFNHHEEVSRLETRATCAQVLLAVRQGLFSTFCNDEGPDATVFVNDCDEDVCLSVFVLKNHGLAAGNMNPALNRLVFMEDMLDTTGGSFPFPSDLRTLQQLMWIFSPYHQFRVSGELDKRDPVAFRGIIREVGERIVAYLTGVGEALDLETDFDLLGNGREGWALVREVGANARIGIYGKGIKAFVALRERGNGRYTYTLARCSQFVRFPIPKLLAALNAAEGRNTNDVWGGSDIVAGSPRISGSRLTPEEVTEIIDSAY